jgi:hypothetical protein
MECQWLTKPTRGSNYISKNAIDILLISETHFSDKSYATIATYKFYQTNHPDCKTH